ncbi:MAG: hypothetical protein ACM3NW_05025 [Syntrophomonadaceae bacterium]
MRRAALVAAGLLLASGAARGQLVPLARCHAAYPCSLPYGLRPADAVANLPDAQLGNALVGVGVDGALKPRLISPPVSGDFAENAARLYVLKNPPPAKPSPTPPPKNGGAPDPRSEIRTPNPEIRP